jgi:hypothetical protein
MKLLSWQEEYLQAEIKIIWHSNRIVGIRALRLKLQHWLQSPSFQFNWVPSWLIAAHLHFYFLEFRLAVSSSNLWWWQWLWDFSGWGRRISWYVRMKKIFWFCLPDFFWSWCRENRIIKFCQMLKKKSKKKESAWSLHTFLCCWWTKKNPWQCFVNRSVCSWGRGLRPIPFSAIYIHWPSSPYNQRKNKVQ